MTDLSLIGDDDRWTLFGRVSVDGYRLIVRARSSNPDLEAFKQANPAIAIRCIPEPEAISDAGMPTNLDVIYRIEDKLISGLSLLDGEAFHVASVTGEGERTIYLAHCPRYSISTVVQLISEHQQDDCRLLVEEVQNRASYLELITPTALERQLDGDMQVIAQLEKQGDEGSSERKTDFWLYGSRQNLELALQELSGLGFAFDHWLEDPSGLVVSRSMAVRFSNFEEVTPRLLDMARNHNVEYDGWETVVVKGQVLPPAEKSETKKSILSKWFGRKEPK